MYALQAPPLTAGAIIDPLIVYTMDDTPDQIMSGPSGHGVAKFLVDSWAKSLTEARELAELIKAGCDNYIGEMGDIDDVAMLVDGDTEVLEVAQDGGQTGAKAVRVTVNVWY
jgi:hypothetical protein